MTVARAKFKWKKLRGIFKQVTTSCYKVTMKSAKITVLWDMTPQHLARDLHHFLWVSCHHFQVGLLGLFRTQISAAPTKSNFAKMAVLKWWLWLVRGLSPSRGIARSTYFTFFSVWFSASNLNEKDFLLVKNDSSVGLYWYKHYTFILNLEQSWCSWKSLFLNSTLSAI